MISSELCWELYDKLLSDLFYDVENECEDIIMHGLYRTEEGDSRAGQAAIEEFRKSSLAVAKQMEEPEVRRFVIKKIGLMAEADRNLSDGFGRRAEVYGGVDEVLAKNPQGESEQRMNYRIKDDRYSAQIFGQTAVALEWLIRELCDKYGIKRYEAENELM